MASKLRRAPLFGIDSGFSLVSPCKTTKGVFQMECEVTSATPTTYGGASRTSGRSSNSPSRTTATAAATNGSVVAAGNGNGGGSASHKSQLHVDFIESNGEVKEKREKYLTAKYGSHQMSLIRKRLSVEMWLYDELQKLFEAQDGSTSTNHEVEIDLDEVLDLDGDAERRKFLLSLLTNAKKSLDVVNKFIDDVLEKAKTL